MPLSLEAVQGLSRANRAFNAAYPGDRPARQPIHTVYGGAQLYKAETTQRLGELARASLETFAPTPGELARGVGFANGESSWLTETVYTRVKAKLEREAVEDFRIDFEDGFGARSDPEEDATAKAAARETARALAQGTLPPFIGIRVKSFNEEWAVRGARTLEIFMTELLEATGGKLPD